MIRRDDMRITITNENGKVLADCEPCRRKSDGEIGYYDYIEDTFVLYNRVTVLDNRNTGESFIDTGIDARERINL